MNQLNKVSIIIFLFIYNNNIFSQNCGANEQACLTKPTGILSGNTKVGDSVTFFNWLLFSASMAGAIIFGIKAARKLSDEQWFPALGPMLGSLVCGLATYIASSVIN